MTVEVAKWRISVDHYHRMIEAGVFDDAPHVELIEGELIQMSPIGKKHSACVVRLNNLFPRRLGERALVSPGNPVPLAGWSEPQPDLMLLVPREDCYASEHPGPADVLLLIEVSDSSLDYDRDVKAPLYARYGIAETWVVDLNGEAVLVHRDPGPEGYRQVTRMTRGQAIAPLAFPDLAIRVDEILG